jgi:hypothetical protein
VGILGLNHPSQQLRQMWILAQALQKIRSSQIDRIETGMKTVKKSERIDSRNKS